MKLGRPPYHLAGGRFLNWKPHNPRSPVSGIQSFFRNCSQSLKFARTLRFHWPDFTGQTSASRALSSWIVVDSCDDKGGMCSASPTFGITRRRCERQRKRLPGRTIVFGERDRESNGLTGCDANLPFYAAFLIVVCGEGARRTRGKARLS
jgi:hypothetical protein